MKETILIKSEQYNIKKIIIAIILIGILISFSIYLYQFSIECQYFEEDLVRHSQEHLRTKGTCNCWICEAVYTYSGGVDYAASTVNISYLYYSDLLIPTLAPVVICTIIGILAHFCLYSCNLTVTDMRVYGKTIWGKRVDLPVDSISAYSTIDLLKCVSISTSSGNISFYAIKNVAEVYSTISNLMISRQHNTKNEHH